MLGRIAGLLNNYDMSVQAFARAFQLDPKNTDLALDYADLLSRSTDPRDSQRGGDMLRELMHSGSTNVRVLSLLAFNAYEAQRYQDAIDAWQMMLKLLPQTTHAVRLSSAASRRRKHRCRYRRSLGSKNSFVFIINSRRARYCPSVIRQVISSKRSVSAQTLMVHHRQRFGISAVYVSSVKISCALSNVVFCNRCSTRPTRGG